jgi:hypothetical protein
MYLITGTSTLLLPFDLLPCELSLTSKNCFIPEHHRFIQDALRTALYFFPFGQSVLLYIPDRLIALNRMSRQGGLPFSDCRTAAFFRGGITCCTSPTEISLKPNLLRSVALKTFNPVSMTLQHPATRRGVIFTVARERNRENLLCGQIYAHVQFTPCAAPAPAMPAYFPFPFPANLQAGGVCADNRILPALQAPAYLHRKVFLTAAPYRIIRNGQTFLSREPEQTL